MATDLGVVLVHGLWHGARAWAAVQDALTERGVDSVAVELPLTSLAADVAAPPRRSRGSAGRQCWSATRTGVP